MEKSDKTVEGGYYIGTDGKPHDANGKPIAAKQSVGKPVKVSVTEDVETSEPAEKPEKLEKPAKLTKGYN